MREIKFRAFNEKSKKFHYWGFLKDGYFVGPENLFGINEQFTGLLDKNGKEIYEGDIIKVSKTIQTPIENIFVKWCDGKFIAERIGYAMDHNIYWASKNGKIVGNIHENPKLLEQGKRKRGKNERN